jgi:serine protease AprX
MRLTRRAATVAVAVLTLSPVLAHASSTPGLPVVDTARASALPSSWPAVPVAERVQPWLAEQLTTVGKGAIRVMVSGETTAAATAAATAAGLTVQQTWSSVGVVVAVGTPDAVRAVVTKPGVTYVEGDQSLERHLSTAHTATRSSEALDVYKAPDGSSVDGTGVTIAVVDSGIDGRHPSFQQDGASKVVRNLENACTVLSGPTDVCFQQEPTNDTDTNSAGGHGTHVAGIAAGVEVTTTSPRQETLRGSAPDARLVGLSVGAGLSLINVNAAMQWIVDHQARPCRGADDQAGGPDADCPPIRVTNHSYGPTSTPQGGFTHDPNSATSRLQLALNDKGVVTVWSAGNRGGDGSIAQTSPNGMNPLPGTLMVANYDDGGIGSRDNGLNSSSSRGDATKPLTFPDLSAPGTNITASCRPYLAVCSTGGDFVNGPGATDVGTFNTISGTSMAAPYIAGVVAQLFEADPTLTPAEAEDLLEDTAYKYTAGAAYEDDPSNPDNTSSFDKGHGLVDVHAALALLNGLPAPDAPAPTCTATSPQVSDAEGDASQIVLLDTPLPSQQSLDVREGRLTWDGDTQQLSFTISVTDLSAGPPAGAIGEYFRFYVTRNSDAETYVVANRRPDAAGGNRFSLVQFNSGASTPLTGTFDEASDTVTVVLPAADYAEVIPGQTLAEGDTFSVGQVLGQRDTGRLTLTADTASGSCPYVLAAPAGSTAPACQPNGKGNGGKGRNGCPAGTR